MSSHHKIVVEFDAPDNFTSDTAVMFVKLMMYNFKPENDEQTFLATYLDETLTVNVAEGRSKSRRTITIRRKDNAR